MMEAKVDLPWETTIGVGNRFNAELEVRNDEPSGTVTCHIWLDGRKVVDSQSAAFARCFDAYASFGDSLANSTVASSVEGYLAEAKQYANEHEYEKALEEFERAAEAAPGFPEVHHQLALFYARREQYDQALGEFDRAIELAPEWVMAHMNRVSTFRMLNNMEAPVRDLDTALDLDPEKIYARRMRADIYAELGDMEIRRST